MLSDPDVTDQALDVMNALMTEFGASAGIGGVELPPPLSAEQGPRTSS